MSWLTNEKSIKTTDEKELGTRRIGLLIFLSITFFMLNIMIYLLFNQVLGITLPNFLAPLLLLIVAIATVGVLYAVFVLANYGGIKRRNKDE